MRDALNAIFMGCKVQRSITFTTRLKVKRVNRIVKKLEGSLKEVIPKRQNLDDGQVRIVWEVEGGKPLESTNIPIHRISSRDMC
jgi:hypothetical protein